MKMVYIWKYGYGYMTNNYSDYLKFATEVGYNITPKGLTLALDTKNSIATESAFTIMPQDGLYLDRQTYNAVGLKFNYEFYQSKYEQIFQHLNFRKRQHATCSVY
jgi:hypothetical protein